MKIFINRSVIFFAFFQILILSTVRNLIGPLIPVISSDLNIGLDYIGSALSLSMFGVLFASFFTGSLIELFGLKKVSILGFLLTLAGTALLIFSKVFSMFIISFFSLQIGVAIIIISVFSIAKDYEGRNKTSITLKVMMGNVAGFALAPLFSGLILFLNWDWHYFFIFSLLPQLLIIIIIFRKDLSQKTNKENNLKELAGINKKLISNINFFTYGIMGFFSESIMFTFFTWFTLYFSGLNILPSISSLYLAFFSVAVIIGMLIKSKLVFKLSENIILLYCFIISFGLLFGILLLNNIILKNILIFLFGIFMGGNFSLILANGVNLFPEYSNSASGLIVAFSNLGVIIFQSVVGYFSEHFSKNSVIYINLIILLILIIITMYITIVSKNKNKTRFLNLKKIVL